MKIGVIAGAGALPLILAREAQRKGKEVLVIAITKETDERLRSLTSEFYQFGAGQLRKIINTITEMDVQEVAVIGKVSKSLLFKPTRLDSRAIMILAKLRDKSDSSIFGAFAAEIESAGPKLVDQRSYLSALLPQKGIITKHRPSKAQTRDIEYGMGLARKIAELDIGQTVVVKDQMPLAIEAMEGTDEAIRRGGRLCGGGAVVAKAARPNHDFRFDVPTVGPDTIDVLVESKAAALGIEFGNAFLLEADQTIQKADEAKISLVVL